MPEAVAETLGRLLLAPADFSTIDDDIVAVGHAVDVNQTERKLAEAQRRHGLVVSARSRRSSPSLTIREGHKILLLQAIGDQAGS